VGEPIHVATGNVWLDQSDATVPGIGPALSFTRSYNSINAFKNRGGAFGVGWHHPYERSITPAPSPHRALTIRGTDGVPLYFQDNDPPLDNIYKPFAPITDQSEIQKLGDGSYRRTFRAGGSEEYDIAGRLTAITDASGHRTLLGYTSGQLTTIQDESSGRALTLGYTGPKLTSLSGPGGPLASYTYDTSERLWTVTYNDDEQTGHVFTYDPSGLLLTVSDRSERVLETHTYVQGTGKGLTSATSGNKEKLTLAYDEHLGKTTVTDALGNTTEYHFTEIQGMKHVLKIMGPCQGCGGGGQQSQEWTYDGNGRTKTYKDGNGRVTEYFYNTPGDLTSMTEAVGTPLARTTQYTNEPVTGLRASRTVPSVVSPGQNKVTSYDYDDGQLHLLTETGLLGSGTPYTYVTTRNYVNGKLASIDGPRTDVLDVTNFAYDPVIGDLTSTTVPHAGTTIYSNFTPLGQAQTITDPNSVATTYTYDTRRRIKTMTIGGHTTSYNYSPSGKLERIDLPRGNSIHYDYDIYDRLEKIRDHFGNYIKYTHDDMSRRQKEEIFDSANALQKTLSFEYDGLHRLKKVINPDALATFTEYGYDLAGNRTSVKNPRNYTTEYHYDELNRLFEAIQPGTVTTQYGHNVHDDLATVSDPENHETTYDYDDMGRVYQEVSPDSGTTTYAHDPAGNRISKSDARAIVINYTYDALNRLTLVDHPLDADIVYTYDSVLSLPCSNGKGRVCQVADQAGTTNYSYTVKGQLWQETRLVLGYSYLTSYSYDSNGNVETITYPSGRVVTYVLDLADRVTSVTTTPPGGGPAQQLANGILYKPFGGMRQVTYGNNLTRMIGYDNQYRISSIQSGGVQNLAYVPDANGNIEVLNNLVDSSRNKTFVYDTLDRLENASGPWGNLGWTYDGVGNRMTYSSPEGNRTYAYQPGTNRLASVSGPGATTFGYDNSGNTTNEGQRAYFYSEAGRLDWAEEPQHLGGYGYYANGQRAIKMVGSFFLVTTAFHYDQTGQLLAETTDTGATGTEYMYLNGQPLAKVTGTALTYIHPDHLGTPVVMTNSTGTNVWDIEVRPFGDAATIAGSGTLNLRFPGQYLDEETGLHQNWWREYMPYLGRYSQLDPLEFDGTGLGGLGGTLSPYLYADGNPVAAVDISGLSAYRLIQLCEKGYRVIRTVGFKRALQAVLRGENVKAGSIREAKRLANAASRSGGPIRDPAHNLSGGGQGMPHFHPNPRTGGHIFYSLVNAAATAGNPPPPDPTKPQCASASDCIKEALGLVHWVLISYGRGELPPVPE